MSSCFLFAYIGEGQGGSAHESAIVNFQHLLFLISLFSPSFAEAQVDAGSVSLTVPALQSVDVVYRGKTQTPPELSQLCKASYSKNKGRLVCKGEDISNLDPVKTSDLWNGDAPVSLASKNQEAKDLGWLLDSSAQFVEHRTSSIGTYRATILQKDSSGQQKLFTLWLSKTSASYLMRKRLLQKIGYRVPPSLRTARLTLKFNGAVSRKLFKERLRIQGAADPKRWVTEENEEDNSIELQDVLILAGSEVIYDLAAGCLSQEIIKGRRILSSLLAPYALVHIPGTLQGWSWTMNPVFNGNFQLPSECSAELSPSLEDVDWIAKKIAKLTKKDFQEVVAATELPDYAQVLLVEKLSSRRNSLLKTLKLEMMEIPVNPQVHAPPNLVNGVLTPLRSPGFATLFSSDNIQEPIVSGAGLRGLLYSKLVSTGLNFIVTKLDTLLLNGTDIEKKVIAAQVKAAKKQLTDFFATGQFSKIPFGIFSFPTLDGNVSVSRDIVIGPYMGNENPVQLADSLELFAAGGIFVSATGLDPMLFPFLHGQVKVSRSYTHLKPIKSISEANKTPIKNLLVHRLMKRNGAMMDVLSSLEFNQRGATEREAVVSEVLEDLNSAMAPGESFIISTNLVGELNFGVGYSLEENLKLQASAYGQKLEIWRLHIYKASDKKIHVYSDLGNARFLGLSFSARAYFPILRIGWQNLEGEANSRFFQLDLDSNIERNPKIVENLVALRQVLKETDLELLESLDVPYILEHKFKQDFLNSGLLNRDQFSADQEFTLKLVDKDSRFRRFFVGITGQRKGKNYQRFVVELINSVIEKEFDSEVVISDAGSGDSGDSIKGESYAQVLLAEAELEPYSSLPIVNLKKRWRGWSAKPRDILKLIEEINSQFPAALISDASLRIADTEVFQLYSLEMDTYIYEQGVAYLANQPSLSLREFIMRRGNFPRFDCVGQMTLQECKKAEWERNFALAKNLEKKHKHWLGEVKAGHSEKIARGILKISELASSLLGLGDLEEFFGGRDNVFIFGRLQAFRKGSESWDQPIVFNTKGQIASEFPRGRLTSIQQSLGIAPGELFLGWILRRL